MPAAKRADRRIVVGFVAVVCAFVVATVLGNVYASRIDAASDTLAFNSSPTIEALARARGGVRRVQLEADRYVRARAEGRPATRDGIDAATRALHEGIGTYLSLPAFPGEQEHSSAVRSAQLGLTEAMQRALTQADLGAAAQARETLETDVEAASERMLDTLARAIEFNARHASALARGIKQTRHDGALVTVALDGMAVALGALALVLLQRSIRRRDELAAARARFAEDRAHDLDVFAGRVAHDLMTPLGGAVMALELIRRSTPDSRAAGLAERAMGSIDRSRKLVDDLLEFTRAGARPEGAPSADLRVIVEGVLVELEPDASRAKIALELGPLPDCRCRCSDGVLASVVSNLVHNAIKYMNEAPVRRVLVRATVTDGWIHFEIEDSGPGLPPELGDSIFEPFVRASGAQQQGIGLGLATVKRLVEAHGGKIGVRSRRGQGATFWFELPRASGAAPEPPRQRLSA